METIIVSTIKCACRKVSSNFLVSQTTKKFSVLSPRLSTISNQSLTLINEKKNQEFGSNGFKGFHTASIKYKKEDKKDRKNIFRTVLERPEGIEEPSIAIDNVIEGRAERFPDENTPDELHDGVRFADLPIVYVKVSRNNTKFTVTDAEGKIKFQNSCGTHGFKRAKKGTNIAAQVTAQAVGQKAREIGVNNVRVSVRGLGPGRMAGVEGLTMGGLSVISITDETPVSFFISPKPRKVRKH